MPDKITVTCCKCKREAIVSGEFQGMIQKIMEISEMIPVNTGVSSKPMGWFCNNGVECKQREMGVVR